MFFVILATGPDFDGHRARVAKRGETLQAGQVLVTCHTFKQAKQAVEAWNNATPDPVYRSGSAVAGTLRGRGAHDIERRSAEEIARNKRDGKRKGHPTGILAISQGEGRRALDEIQYGFRGDNPPTHKPRASKPQTAPEMDFAPEDWNDSRARKVDRRLTAKEAEALAE